MDSSKSEEGNGSRLKKVDPVDSVNLIFGEKEFVDSGRKVEVVYKSTLQGARFKNSWVNYIAGRYDLNEKGEPDVLKAMKEASEINYINLYDVLIMIIKNVEKTRYTNDLTSVLRFFRKERGAFVQVVKNVRSLMSNIVTTGHYSDAKAIAEDLKTEALNKALKSYNPKKEFISCMILCGAERFDNAPGKRFMCWRVVPVSDTLRKRTDQDFGYKDKNKKVCSACYNYGEGYKTCNNCKLVYYCSKECQKLDWKKEHRGFCMRHKQLCG